MVVSARTALVVVAETTDGQARLLGTAGDILLTLEVDPSHTPPTMVEMFKIMDDLGYEVDWERERLLESGQVRYDAPRRGRA